MEKPNPKKNLFLKKLDGVGPIDNRPSSDKLPRFVRTRDTSHVTRLGGGAQVANSGGEVSITFF
jgi:hypothetical protein